MCCDHYFEPRCTGFVPVGLVGLASKSSRSAQRRKHCQCAVGRSQLLVGFGHFADHTIDSSSGMRNVVDPMSDTES